MKNYIVNIRELLFVVSIFVAFILMGNVNSLTAQQLSNRNFGISPESIVSLDGEWLIKTDSLNVGKDKEWWKAPISGAKPVKVPWILQDVYPAYHGVVWYWRDFMAPINRFPSDRTLLRFGSIDYLGDIWLNSTFIGHYESGNVPFVVDVTKAIKPGQINHLSVRVLNPTNEPIDGLTLQQIPHQARVIPYRSGAEYNSGGITGSVELLSVPMVRVEDLFASGDTKEDVVKIEVNLRNAGTKTIRQHLEFNLTPATSGEVIKSFVFDCNVPPGDTLIKKELKIGSYRLWDINDPYLYRMNVRNTSVMEKTFDEQSVRFGFRDFRFDNGYFRLNGRRIFLRSAHTCNNFPIGQRLPINPDQARRDLLDMKVMGFNTIRFIWGGALPYQLDLCDEIGLMVYNESYSSSDRMDTSDNFQRFDHSQFGMIKRDRNHPSLIIWGLLNETFDGPIFRHAVEMLPQLKFLDNTRMFILGSGRWDGQYSIGTISNPGSQKWEHLLGTENPGIPIKYTDIKDASLSSEWGGYKEGSGDVHFYPKVPQLVKSSDFIRNFGKNSKQIFLSEYGIGSAVDLWRVTRHFERYGKESAEDAKYYKERLDRYLDDWEKWELDKIYPRPEDFFAESLRRMASQRTLGLTAIRSNPNIIGYNLTGMNDHVMTGEGLTTTFRELKPGTVDAMFEGLAPLRWCLFAEPKNMYRGETVKLEVILANEDVLAAGEYPALIQVIGPDNLRVYEHNTTIRIPATQNGAEPPLAFPVFSKDLTINGPPGNYLLLATLEKGGAPTCGKVKFYIDDANKMPIVETEVTLWGKDTLLENWLSEHNVKTKPLNLKRQKSREVILAGLSPPEGVDTSISFTMLMQHVARGSTVIFLSPEVFKKGDDPVGFLPLENKGTLSTIHSWLYLKDDWAKQEQIFEGLPSGGLMDHQFYREIIPSMVWMDQNPPKEAVAGAIKASQDYSSGLTMAVYPFGDGNFILNTLLIRDNLGSHPASARLLLNLLRYAGMNQKEKISKVPEDWDEKLKAINYK